MAPMYRCKMCFLSAISLDAICCLILMQLCQDEVAENGTIYFPIISFATQLHIVLSMVNKSENMQNLIFGIAVVHMVSLIMCCDTPSVLMFVNGTDMPSSRSTSGSSIQM